MFAHCDGVGRGVARALLAGAVAAATLVGCSGIGSGSAAPPTLTSSATPRSALRATPGAEPGSGRPAGAVDYRLRIQMARWRLPVAVSRAAAFADGNQIVLAGGLASDGSSMSSVWQVDPATGITHKAGQLADAVHDAAGVLLNGRALVIGGGDANIVDDVQAVVTGSIGEVIGHLPRARADVSAIANGTTTYVVGGYDGSALDPSVLATTDGHRFVRIAALPVPVRYAALAYADGAVWVFGGQAAGGQTADIQRIDPRTGRASVVTRLPAQLSETAAVQLAGQIYLCGGLLDGRPSTSVWRFDPARRVTSRAGQLPEALADTAGVTVGGTGYLLGGETPASSRRVLTLQLVPSTGGSG